MNLRLLIKKIQGLPKILIGIKKLIHMGKIQFFKEML
jgi:hypothetical protein